MGEIKKGRQEGPSQTGGAREERRVFALEPRMPAGLTGEVPCPLRPGVGATPGPLLFLESKPHPSQPPGPFIALWVLSIGPTLHSKCLSPTFFFLFPPPLFYYCGTDVPSGC